MATTAVLHLPAFTLTATPELPPLRPHSGHRRRTPQQGRALETLGHAVEYLVDSRLVEGGPLPADTHAIHLLMACSRSVFEDCPVVLPMHRRFGNWMQDLLRKRIGTPATS